MKEVVERLLPQARQIGVYLNGYDHVPPFLRRRRIVVARSQDYGDIRDNGKFFFLDRSDARYYASVDDDLLYPHDYLARLVECLTVAEQRAAVGVHGAIYPSPIVDLFDPRYLLHFEDSLPHVMPVHLLGTGTTLIDQSDWKLEPNEFGTPGMADIWFAAAAAKREASLFAAPRPRNWVSSLDTRSKGRSGALFFEGLLDSSQQVSVLKQAAPPTRTVAGLVTPLLASAGFSEEFSLHQALYLDRIRTQLGYAPLSDEAASPLAAQFEARGETWSDDHGLGDEDTRAAGRLVMEILCDRVSSDSVVRVLEFLDRLHGLALTEPRRWSNLPAAVRYDSSPDRVEQLKTTLLERGMHRALHVDAGRLWRAFESRVDISLNLALAAERASIRTRFERLPAFMELARENPTAAAARLYDYFEAVDWSREPDLPALQAAFGAEYESLDIQMLVCMASQRSGQREFAMRTAKKLRRRWPWDGDVRLLEAGLSSDVGTPGDVVLPVFQVLDHAVEPLGLTAYRDLLREGGADEHWIHHLAADEPEQIETVATPTVSVLMTAYNDTATIRAAMSSILASQGVDLQLVVVDDASTDDTLQQMRSVDDARVTVLRNDVNSGPYVSRNRGLGHATGEYVAIADADDWSHPQRLEYQSSILEVSPHLVACKVAHVRIRPSGLLDLENHLRFVGDGPVSLMFRRWLIDHIGGFDHVRTRGDIEYLRRIAARFGPDAMTSFGTPLILATSSRSSNSKQFREESLNLYRAASRNWHEQRAHSDALYVPLSGSRAPFMAPYDLLAEHRPQDRFDGMPIAQESAL